MSYFWHFLTFFKSFNFKVLAPGVVGSLPLLLPLWKLKYVEGQQSHTKCWNSGYRWKNELYWHVVTSVNMCPHLVCNQTSDQCIHMRPPMAAENLQGPTLLNFKLPGYFAVLYCLISGLPLHHPTPPAETNSIPWPSQLPRGTDVCFKRWDHRASTCNGLSPGEYTVRSVNRDDSP